MKKTANILVYISSASAIPLTNGKTERVGVFLGELTEPLQPLIAEGHQIHFTSPDGNAPFIDPNSFKLMYWGWSRRKLEQAKATLDRLEALGMNQPKPIADVLEGGLDRFDMLFVPGGHAPMTDILHENWLESEKLNRQTASVLLHFHEKKKPTALICHAPAVLAAVPDVDGNWPYKGYRMTCVTMLSESLVESAPFFKTIDGHMPDYPQKILERKGANLQLQWIPMLPKVVEDRELITGQDPYSARALGDTMLGAVRRYLDNANQQ